MELKVQGRIKVINDLQTWDSGFSKREFVITTQEQYPQDVKFEALKEKATQLDTLNVGDDIEVSFNLRGNEYNGKYYVNLQAWKLTKSGATTESAPAPTAPDTALEPMSEAEDDLPF